MLQSSPGGLSQPGGTLSTNPNEPNSRHLKCPVRMSDTPYWKDEDAREVPETLTAADGEDGCPKCGHREAETDGIAVTGDGLSRYPDYQNREFTVVSCAECGYSELYRGTGSGDLIDLFFA